jgi:hypothetical protein
MNFMLSYAIMEEEQDILDAGVLFMLATYLHSTTLRTRNYISTAGLREPLQSSGQHLYVHGTDGDYLSVMGIDRDTFKHLFDHFSDFYVVSSGPGRSGRPPKLSSKGTVLACLLHFYAGTMELKTLCELFGVPPATLSRIVHNAEVALEECLRVIPEAKITWPSFAEQHEWAARVERKEPLLKGRWGFVDGKNYRVQKPTNADLQNAMYNGNPAFNSLWKGDVGSIIDVAFHRQDGSTVRW